MVLISFEPYCCDAGGKKKKEIRKKEIISSIRCLHDHQPETRFKKANFAKQKTGLSCIPVLLVCSEKLQPQKVNNNYNNTKKN